MNDIVAVYPDTAIHVVLDNLNTHKPKNDRWLKRHANVQFHFTPTRASWLNQVEIWFSILQGKSLHGASFTSVNQLRQHIDAFIAAYNESQAVRLDQIPGPPKTPQTSFRGSVIPGTRMSPGGSPCGLPKILYRKKNPLFRAGASRLQYGAIRPLLSARRQLYRRFQE